jgi:multicomponent Na+:H+ antiporter subunit E
VIAVGLPAILYFGFWLLLSGHYEPFYLALGALSSLAVAVTTRDLELATTALRVVPGFLAYLPWLLVQIVKANIEVVRVVLDPRLPADPVVVRVTTPLRSPLGITTLGNSITLTPGTITLDVEGQELVVHALTRAGAGGVQSGAMDARIARIFPPGSA